MRPRALVAYCSMSLASSGIPRRCRLALSSGSVMALLSALVSRNSQVEVGAEHVVLKTLRLDDEVRWQVARRHALRQLGGRHRGTGGQGGPVLTAPSAHAPAP